MNCQHCSIKIEMLEEEVRDLADRERQLKRINESLVRALLVNPMSQHHHLWKQKFEQQARINVELCKTILQINRNATTTERKETATEKIMYNSTSINNSKLPNYVKEYMPGRSSTLKTNKKQKEFQKIQRTTHVKKINNPQKRKSSKEENDTQRQF